MGCIHCRFQLLFLQKPNKQCKKPSTTCNQLQNLCQSKQLSEEPLERQRLALQTNFACIISKEEYMWWDFTLLFCYFAVLHVVFYSLPKPLYGDDRVARVLHNSPSQPMKVWGLQGRLALLSVVNTREKNTCFCASGLISPCVGISGDLLILSRQQNRTSA